MQPMLAAAARYFDVPGTWVVPAGLTGSAALFRYEPAPLHPARVVLQIGRPILAATLVGQAAGDRRHVIDAVGLAIAELLPGAYRGVYRDERFPDAARILRTARA